MDRKWTTTHGARDASQGPWVDRSDLSSFLKFCVANGHITREHPDPWIDGWQVEHKGHWMSLLWNKSRKRYTADRRLSLIVQSFATQKKEQP